MNEVNLAVLTNIIGAVESGGQVYGKRDYARYTPPYKNSAKEHTVTLGWYQAYGHEAKQLIREIYEADRDAFWHIDNAGIAEMLDLDWVAIRWNPDKKEKAALVALIDSTIGHEVQDRIFTGKMEKLIAECAKEYTEDIKAQMMYCEIRHLGGKGPCDRIFKRCSGKYDLDTIMASLVTDQRDPSSENQVGDKIYWSRHLKCREFIDRYAVDESEEKMAVIIGSARGDEYGGSGWDGRAKAGDQKQTSTDDWKGEVSKQEWYLHSKGWYVFRAKDPEKREKIALNTEYACANKNVGYDQSENRTMLAKAKKVGYDVSKITEPCETDCGQLQYNGIWFAGIHIDDFYTANMKAAIEKTGEFYVFTDDAHCKSSERLLRGDLLCTRSKGHVVCTLTDGSKAAEERAKYDGKATDPAPAPAPTYIVGTCQLTLKKFLPGAKDPQIKAIQRILNATGYKGKNGKTLKVDGELGENTAYAIAAFQKAAGLSIDNPGSVAVKTWRALIEAK